MKITNFKDVEAYIYLNLVLPFKGLSIPRLDVSSPISGDSGEAWGLGLYRQELHSRYRRNYQRDEARNNRNWMFGLHDGSRVHVIGEYQIRNRWVKLYESPFKELGAMPLLGKIYTVCDRDSQFSKVIVKNEKPYGNSPRDVFAQFDSKVEPPLERCYPSQPQEIPAMARNPYPQEAWFESDDEEDEPWS